MKNPLFLKAITIFLLVLFLMIPLALVNGVIGERERYRQIARQDIAASWTAEQKLVGPILVVPYQVQVRDTVWDKKLAEHVERIRIRDKVLYLPPEQLEIDSTARTELRFRGLYGVPVYTSQIAVSGKFANHAVLELVQRQDNIVAWGAPFVAVIVSDIRGITKRPMLQWNDRQQEFESGSGIKKAENGMRAVVPALNKKAAQELRFSFSVALRGMEKLSFSPLGKNTQVSLSSDWRHPSFIGRFLPEERNIDDNGFSAQWQASSFSSNADKLLDDCKKGSCGGLVGNTFGVSLTQPIDIYRQTERSAKYGILFITLTFVVFLIFELMKRLAIHPVQYLLVGLELLIFYLLLVSLSEHIAFAWAYSIATAACSFLLAVYLSAVLKNTQYGSVSGGAIAVLYGVLYVIIGSEDMALLMGSVLLFTMLAVVMLVTRNVDWYSFSNRMTSNRVNQ